MFRAASPFSPPNVRTKTLRSVPSLPSPPSSPSRRLLPCFSSLLDAFRRTCIHPFTASGAVLQANQAVPSFFPSSTNSDDIPFFFFPLSFFCPKTKANNVSQPTLISGAFFPNVSQCVIFHACSSFTANVRNGVCVVHVDEKAKAKGEGRCTVLFMGWDEYGTGFCLL